MRFLTSAVVATWGLTVRRKKRTSSKSWVPQLCTSPQLLGLSPKYPAIAGLILLGTLVSSFCPDTRKARTDCRESRNVASLEKTRPLTQAPYSLTGAEQKWEGLHAQWDPQNYPVKKAECRAAWVPPWHTHSPIMPTLCCPLPSLQGFKPFPV